MILGCATQHHLPQPPTAGDGKDRLQRPAQPKTGGGTAQGDKSLPLHPGREPLGAARGDDAQRRSELPPRRRAGTNCGSRNMESLAFLFFHSIHPFHPFKNRCLKGHFFLYFKVSKAPDDSSPVSLAELRIPVGSSQPKQPLFTEGQGRAGKLCLEQKPPSGSKHSRTKAPPFPKGLPREALLVPPYLSASPLHLREQWKPHGSRCHGGTEVLGFLHPSSHLLQRKHQTMSPPATSAGILPMSSAWARAIVKGRVLFNSCIF